MAKPRRDNLPILIGLGFSEPSSSEIRIFGTTNFPNALIISSHDSTTGTHNGNIGIVGEGVADGTMDGYGVYAFGKASSTNMGWGVIGRGIVSGTDGTTTAVGLYGCSFGSSTTGSNIGVWGFANNRGPNIGVQGYAGTAGGGPQIGVDVLGGFLRLNNDTTGTSPDADHLYLTGTDISAGNTIPMIYTEGAEIISSGTITTNTHNLALNINGTIFYINAGTVRA